MSYAEKPAKIDGRSRPRDIERTRAEILAAALQVFAEKGLASARVDDIAALTGITKPAIYYHFQSKEKLYAAVLEAAYGGMRDMETSLDLDMSDPAGAMRRLVEASFDYHAAHPEWVRLVSIENIHGARHIAGMPEFGHRSRAATKASCASSSAMPTSRVIRARPAMSLADSMRQTASMVG